MLGDIVGEVGQQPLRVGALERAGHCPHQHGRGAETLDGEAEVGKLRRVLLKPVAGRFVQLDHLGDQQRLARCDLFSSPGRAPVIEIVPANWYNPYLNYRLFMVPGVLAILVTMIGGFLAALNIVKEKEVGTIEQINVTPIKKHHFILGKLIPFWVLGNIVFTLGLLVSWLIYGIIPVGSLLVLYGFISVYLLAILGFGLLISTFCDTQQQAMFIMFFFMMIFILMGGLFTSIDSMPAWAKGLAQLNPVSYLIEVMRMVIMKGSGFREVLPHLGIVALFALVLNSWAVYHYKKKS